MSYPLLHHHLLAVPDVDAWGGWCSVQARTLQAVPVTVALRHIIFHEVDVSRFFRELQREYFRSLN